MGTQTVSCERGNERSRLWTERGIRINRRMLQRIVRGLQLGKIFDTLADTALKGILQRNADAGNTDQGVARVKRIGEGGIEFGAKADQTRSIGRGELEDAGKPGCRLQQTGPMSRLRIGFSRGRITKLSKQRPGIGIIGAFRFVAQQQRRGARKQIRHLVSGLFTVASRPPRKVYPTRTVSLRRKKCSRKPSSSPWQPMLPGRTMQSQP